MNMEASIFDRQLPAMEAFSDRVKLDAQRQRAAAKFLAIAIGVVNTLKQTPEA